MHRHKLTGGSCFPDNKPYPKTGHPMNEPTSRTAWLVSTGEKISVLARVNNQFAFCQRDMSYYLYTIFSTKLISTKLKWVKNAWDKVTVTTVKNSLIAGYLHERAFFEETCVRKEHWVWTRNYKTDKWRKQWFWKGNWYWYDLWAWGSWNGNWWWLIQFLYTLFHQNEPYPENKPPPKLSSVFNAHAENKPWFIIRETR